MLKPTARSIHQPFTKASPSRPPTALAFPTQTVGMVVAYLPALLMPAAPSASLDCALPRPRRAAPPVRCAVPPIMALMQGFYVTVMDSAKPGADLCSSLHTYVYNAGHVAAQARSGDAELALLCANPAGARPSAFASVTCLGGGCVSSSGARSGTIVTCCGRATLRTCVRWSRGGWTRWPRRRGHTRKLARTLTRAHITHTHTSHITHTQAAAPHAHA
jgi:hypothetical protein